MLIAVRLTGLAPVIMYAMVLACLLILRAVRFFHDPGVIDASDSVLTSSKRNVLLSHGRLYLHQSQHEPSDMLPTKCHRFALDLA